MRMYRYRDREPEIKGGRLESYRNKLYGEY